MEGPEVHAPHAPHTGHRWWDFAIGGTAVIVSLISLYVAVHHGEIMERLVAANSWPNVQVDVLVARGEAASSARLDLTALNNGVGPARIETLEVWIGGKPVTGARKIIETIKAAGGGGPLVGRLEGSTIVGSVLGAREKSVIVSFEVPDGAKWAVPIIRTGSDIQTRTCYCSVFDECYVADTRSKQRRPEKQDSCPVPATPFDDEIGAAVVDATTRPALPAGPAKP